MALPKRCADLKQAEARTVTTGHQLCLAMGPAFTWYKVMTAITLAARLETRWGTPVIPVFWLASEDHDFEEIASVWSGKEWHKWAVGDSSWPASIQGIPVGMVAAKMASPLQAVSISGASNGRAVCRWNSGPSKAL